MQVLLFKDITDFGAHAHIDESRGCVNDFCQNKIDVNYQGSTPGDIHGIVGDFSKFKNDTGWNPRIRFKDGFTKMIEWSKSINLLHK